MNAFLRAWTAVGFEYLISFRAEPRDAEILWKSTDFFSEINVIDTQNKDSKLVR